MMKVIKADSSSPAAEPSPCLWFCWGWLARSGSLQQATTGKGMNQVFQASPVRSDSFKPWIRALGLLCWLQISSWFPAYNFTFKARGLETFPVSPAPAGRAQHHLLSCTHKRWLCWKNKVWPHENTISAPLHSADSTAKHKSGAMRCCLGFMLLKNQRGSRLCYSKRCQVHLSVSELFLDFYNIRYFCLAKKLQNKIHSIIRKHLAKISWERNHPKEARNLRALPLTGQRNVLIKK